MSNPVWCVKEVVPNSDYTMLLTFESGEQRIYDAKPLLKKEICASLREPSFFAKAQAQFGTVVWSDNIDIAPEFLYENSVPVLAKEKEP